MRNTIRLLVGLMFAGLITLHAASLFASTGGFSPQLQEGLPQTRVPALAITRGPYLQLGTPSSLVIRWRTDVPSTSSVHYGPSPSNLTLGTVNNTLTTEHQITLMGLSPATTYYYAIGTSSGILIGGDFEHFFVTPPVVGSDNPTRIWVLGDSGTGNSRARQVRDAYYAYTGDRRTDLWLMLGDNAYTDGTDAEYQSAVFDIYADMLQRSVLWPAFGNHDALSASSATQSGPYYDIFSLPRAGEAGGIASGTEAYFSFDYANIHFIVLNTEDILNLDPTSMVNWLSSDLAANHQEWTIALWHRPPYSKGSHDSDTEGSMVWMRETIVPILEESGVDLVLAGHSHSYERSYLLDGHYGASSTLTAAMKKDDGNGAVGGDGAYVKLPGAHQGAVYAVVGCSGSLSNGQLNHPAMVSSQLEYGSMVLDVAADRLDAVFLGNTGDVLDNFTMIKSGTSPSPSPTATATATATHTPTASPTATSSPTPTSTPTITATPSPSATASPSSTPTATATAFPTQVRLYLPLIF